MFLQLLPHFQEIILVVVDEVCKLIEMSNINHQFVFNKKQEDPSELQQHQSVAGLQDKFAF